MLDDLNRDDARTAGDVYDLAISGGTVVLPGGPARVIVQRLLPAGF